MKKIIFILLITGLLVLTGCAGPAGPSASPSDSAYLSVVPSASPSATPPVSPSPSPSLTVADYFPFTPNVHRGYLGTGIEYAGFESWVDFITADTIQIRSNNTGTETVSVYKIENGELKNVFSQGETYYVYDYTAMNTMNDVLIKEPIAVGTTWTLPSGDQRTITDVDASVTMPYGAFTGVLEVTTTNPDSVIKDYYAPGIGFIKQAFIPNEDPDNPIVSELQVYETDAYLSQNIQTFYPDSGSGTAYKVTYMNQTVPFSTNDTAASVFERILKTAPSSSSLTPVMSPDAALNSLTMDTQTNVLTVDVSAQFITGMNAGASYEGMILESLADTLGRYFQTDKIQLTVDGGPYESGHFLFNDGDYLPFAPDDAVQYS